MPARIRKGDRVVVHLPARTRASRGIVLEVRPDEQRVLVEGAQHHEAPHQAAPAERAGRRHRAAGADPPVQRALIDPKDDAPDPGAHRGDRRRARARRRALRGEARLMADETADHRSRRRPRRRPARLRDDLREGDPPAAPGGVRLPVADAAPDAREDHPQHGRRRGQDQQQGPRRGHGAARASSPASARASRRARKSIAQFKLREGMAIGCKVTLRGNRMWEFLDRLDVGRPPAHPRLPRHQPGRLRRPRQLQPRACASRRSSRRSTTTTIDAVRGLNVTITTTAGDRRGGPGAPRGTSACRSARRATRPRSGQPAVGASRRSSAAAAAVGRGESWQRPAFG